MGELVKVESQEIRREMSEMRVGLGWVGLRDES